MLTRDFPTPFRVTSPVHGRYGFHKGEKNTKIFEKFEIILKGGMAEFQNSRVKTEFRKLKFQQTPIKP
jgi:hypothetical protein